MKTIFFKTALFTFLTLLFISCSKDENASSTENNTGNTTVNTWAKFTITSPDGVVKPNYIVMMFDQPFSPTENLPAIIKQATSDANGLAYLDLKTIVTSTTPKRYYFEAFVETASGYELKTNFSRFSTELEKGTTLTTSLLVN